MENDENVLDAAFTRGNYHRVAASNANDRWQTFAALGLCGSISKALDGLGNFDTEIARFYEGVTHWIDGEEDKAARILEKCSGLHAANLLALIRKPRIDVLCQLLWEQFGGGPNMIRAAAIGDPKFNISNIAYRESDFQHGANADIHNFYDPASPPDMYFAHMLEWQLLPRNLQELPCPAIGFTADYNLHIHAINPWLQLFDHLIVSGTDEHEDVARLSDAQVHTFPKTICLPMTLPPQIRQPRLGSQDIDILVSSSSFSDFHRDKAELALKILGIEGIVSIFTNENVDWKQHERLLTRSRLSLSHSRFPGLPPARGMEPLSIGVGLLAPSNSTLNLWAGADEGLHLYEPETLASTVQHILKDFPIHHAAARRGMDVIRHEFEPCRLASQYFRFATFLASKPTVERGIKPRPSHKGMTAAPGWLQAIPSAHEAIRHDAFKEAKRTNPATADLETLNAPARETMLACARKGDLESRPDQLSNLATKGLGLYRSALQAKPDSLALRFNCVRAALHFGNDSDIEDALSMITETLASNLSSMNLTAHDDVMTWDYCSEFFNYRSFLDTATNAIAANLDERKALKTLIRASLHYYRGRMTGSLEDFAAAAALDPEFPPYRLWWAKALDAAGGCAQAETAITILTELATTSLHAIDAWTLMQSIATEHGFDIPDQSALHGTVERLESQFLVNTDYDAKWDSAYSKSQRLNLSRNEGVEVRKADRVSSAKISILLADLNGSGYRALIDSLAQQQLARDQYEIICAEVYDRNSPHMMAAANIVLACGQTGYLHNRNAAFNAALAQAHGDYVIYFDRDAHLCDDGLNRILKSLGSGDTAPTAIVNQDADPSDPPSLYCLALRRSLAVGAGGLEESACRTGAASGPYELALRLANRSTSFVPSSFLPPSRGPDATQRTELLKGLWPYFYTAENYLPIAECPDIEALRKAMK